MWQSRNQRIQNRKDYLRCGIDDNREIVHDGLTERCNHRNDKVKQYREMLHKHIDNLGYDVTDDFAHLAEVTLCVLNAVGELTE